MTSYRVYDSHYRGECPTEALEQMTFFNRLRKQHPKFAALGFHVRNEGKKTHAQVQMEKAEGMTPGVSDIIIIHHMPFVCELKRKDKTKTKLPSVEQNFLMLAAKNGAFACIAYGCDEAWRAFNDWLLCTGNLSE